MHEGIQKVLLINSKSIAGVSANLNRDFGISKASYKLPANQWAQLLSGMGKKNIPGDGDKNTRFGFL